MYCSNYCRCGRDEDSTETLNSICVHHAHAHTHTRLTPFNQIKGEWTCVVCRGMAGGWRSAPDVIRLRERVSCVVGRRNNVGETHVGETPIVDL